MKKRNVIASLVLAGALCFTSVAGVFAATFPGKDIKETDVEKVTYQFMNETKAGKYKLADTAQVKSWVDSKSKMIVIDTMPASSYGPDGANGHIPGAINSVAPMTEKEYTAAQKKDLTDKVTKLLPNKTVTKTTWSKVSKKTYKKLKKSMRKTKKVKKGKKTKTYYYKKVVKKSVIKDKSYKIVVYCGHIGCARSHVAAAYLVKQGYTNVYRYGGGITAWVDAGYAVDGKKATVEEPTQPTTPEQPTTPSDNKDNTGNTGDAGSNTENQTPAQSENN